MTYIINTVANGWVVRGDYQPYTAILPTEEYVFNEFKDAAKFLKDNLKLRENE